ncbi:hypothetical protein AB0M02_44265 [Actinoplanes sp. NPDC051861]|uniref:hypothetical protein n=1 Tax=Actinoplanes sp. NPDC051861 TaxID=3155170 RepID=UPI003431DCD5
MTVYGGDIIYAADLNALPQGTIARYARTTSSTGVTTTETGYIRIDNVAVRAGYSYRVTWHNPISNWATSASTPSLRIRGTQSGTAGTGSTQLRGGFGRSVGASDANNGPVAPVIGIWECTSSGTLSVLATFVRASGTGTVGMFASGAAESLMTVEEVGLTQADSGTSV